MDLPLFSDMTSVRSRHAHEASACASAKKTSTAIIVHAALRNKSNRGRNNLAGNLTLDHRLDMEDVLLSRRFCVRSFQTHLVAFILIAPPLGLGG